MIMVAIAGQPTSAARMPPEAPAAAIAAVDRLAADLAADELFGFLQEPPITVVFDPHGDKLGIGGRRIRGRGGSLVTIDWVWGRLWSTDDWYEDGWHPDEYFFGLQAWDGGLADRLWDALNPGKRLREHQTWRQRQSHR